MANRERDPTAIRVRQYGTAGPWVVLLHGGPGAGGYLAPLARQLADSFRVLEPLQRASGGDPLSVGVHVRDLDGLVQKHCGGARPVLVGHSWGAMLALAYTAEHTSRVQSLVLIGCGTFDSSSREHLRAIIEERMDDGLRRRLEHLAEDCPDPDERLRVVGDLMLPLYSYAPATSELELEVCDAQGYAETWEDMLRLQEEGVYPRAFTAIQAPVLMLHGAVDPHPGRLIDAALRPFLPQLEYREFEHCGHYPWLEREARGEFSAAVRHWIAQYSRSTEPPNNQMQRTRRAQATEPRR